MLHLREQLVDKRQVESVSGYLSRWARRTMPIIVLGSMSLFGLLHDKVHRVRMLPSAHDLVLADGDNEEHLALLGRRVYGGKWTRYESASPKAV